MHLRVVWDDFTFYRFHIMLKCAEPSSSSRCQLRLIIRLPIIPHYAVAFLRFLFFYLCVHISKHAMPNLSSLHDVGMSKRGLLIEEKGKQVCMCVCLFEARNRKQSTTGDVVPPPQKTATATGLRKATAVVSVYWGGGAAHSPRIHFLNNVSMQNKKGQIACVYVQSHRSRSR